METKHYALPPLPPPIDRVRYQKRLARVYRHIEHSQQILQKFPYTKLTFILKLREAFFSLSTQGMGVTFEKLCELHSKNKDSSLLRKRVKNYLEAFSYIEKINSPNDYGAHFWEHLHGLVERDFGKSPEELGHIREKQNWIGPKGCKMEQAFFYPPAPQEIRPLLQKLSKYLHSKEDPLVQLGIGFAQFLFIHPFMDGNGRVARLFAAAFLYQRKQLCSAVLFLSEYFLYHRLPYLKNLFLLTKHKNWDRWFSFYLKGIEKEAYCLSLRLKKLYALYQKIDRLLPSDLAFSQRKQIILFLFENPVFSKTLLKKKTKISSSLQEGLLDLLVRKKLIKKKTPSLYYFSPLLLLGKKETRLK